MNNEKSPMTQEQAYRAVIAALINNKSSLGAAKFDLQKQGIEISVPQNHYLRHISADEVKILIK